MASPFAVHSTSAVTGAAYSPTNRVAILGDGSVLTSLTTATGVTTLLQITNPSSSAPTVTALTQTFAISSSTVMIADICVGIGTASGGGDDVWLFYCSDSGSGSQVLCAHAVYSGGTFTWDNTSHAIATVTSVNSQLGNMVWTGTYLIAAWRDGATWHVEYSYTTDKTGATGWATPAQLSTTTMSGSHAEPILRHDDDVAGGTGATICVYTIDTSSSHSDRFGARVLLDSAASPAAANWHAESVNTAVTGQNTGTATLAATIDPADGAVHLLYASSVAGTGGVIGVSYIKVTVDSTGAVTWGSRVTVDTTTGASTVSICVDVLGTIYAFYSTGSTPGTNGVIQYRTASSPYTSFSAANSTVATTAGDSYPHVPGHDQAVSGYIPLLYQRGASTANFDNTITAGTTITPSNGSGGGATGASTATGTGTFTAPTTTVNGSGGGVVAATAHGTGTLSITSATGSGQGQVGASTASGTGSFVGPVTVGLSVSTETQSGITGGPPGNNTTQTTITSEDASGNGWAVGMIPAYGGMPFSPVYEMDAAVRGPNQVSLATSNPDGFLHILAQNGSGVFTGTEDPTFSPTELAPTGLTGRRWYDTGTVQPSTGPALRYRIRTVVYPGDPGFLFHRIDITNPSASAVSLATTDSLEVAMIGGLQQSDATWATGNGKYGTVGGTEAAWPGTLTTANPDYCYITPASGHGVSISPFTVKKTGLVEAVGMTSNQVEYLQNSSRLKFKLQASKSSIPGSASYTLYYLQGFRRNAVTADFASIAADYLNPDSAATFSQVAGGSAGGYSYDEGCNLFASTTGVGVEFMHSITSPVTKRWNPAYKITGWTGTSPTVPVAINGATLTEGSDVLTHVDTTNGIAYVKVLRSIVPSGATGTDINNGLVVIGSAAPSSGTGSGHSGQPRAAGTATFTLPVRHGVGVGSVPAHTTGTGTNASPTFTGSGGGAEAAVTASGTGTMAVTPRNGVGIGSVAARATGTGTSGAPAYTGTGSARPGRATAAGTGTFLLPAYHAIGRAVSGAPGASGTGTAAIPHDFGLGIILALAAGTGSFTPPSYAGSARVGARAHVPFRVGANAEGP